MSTWRPGEWSFNPVVVVDGEVVGSQGIGAREFPVRRVCETGSWLGRRHQGKGIGKEMRAAIVHFAFAGLGAVRCESGYWHDNEPSRRVSAGLGYEENGDKIVLRRGRPDRIVDMKLEHAVWEQRRRHDIEIVGLAPCLELFGLTADLQPLEAGDGGG